MRIGIPVLGSALLLFSAGCCWFLPPGDPPSGDIETLVLPAERDRRGAENDTVTSLFAYTLQHHPGAAMSVEADVVMLPVARRIIERTGKISGIRYAAQAPLVLRADESNGRWSFQLYDSARASIVWQEVFVLKP